MRMRRERRGEIRRRRRRKKRKEIDLIDTVDSPSPIRVINLVKPSSSCFVFSSPTSITSIPHSILC